MLSPLTLRQQTAAIATAAFTGFIIGMAAYILLEVALS
jgi:hypothetical protein